MASLLYRAISLSSPNPRFLQFRYASSAASLPSSPNFQKKSEQFQKSADSAHNCCIIQVPCPTRKLESSSFPSSIRTDSINISEAVDSAVQRLQRESEHPITEDDLSLEIIDCPDSTYKLKIKAPGEIIKAKIRIDDGRWDESYLDVKIKREHGYYFEYDGSHFCYKWPWDSWLNHFNSRKYLEPESKEACQLMTGRSTMHLESILAKKGINMSVNEWLTAYIDNKRRITAQLTWMDNVKDFVQN